jgi:hypothetical protein
MRGAGEKVYTYEMIISPTRKEVRALFSLLTAAGVQEDKIEIPSSTTVEIREYNPGAGTSRTLRSIPRFPPRRRRARPSTPYYFQVDEGSLYLFGSDYDAATNAYSIRITGLSLTDLRETSTVVATVGGASGIGSFNLRGGWLYCVAGFATGHLTDPSLPARVRDHIPVVEYTICRINLSTGERQSLVSEPWLDSFGILDNPNAVVYVRLVKSHEPPGRVLALRAVPLDGTPSGPADHFLPPGVMKARLSADDQAGQALMLRTLEVDSDDRSSEREGRFYRVSRVH